MSFAVLDVAGLWPTELLLADQVRIFDMPIAATRTASQRIFPLRWHCWCSDRRKALRNAI